MLSQLIDASCHRDQSVPVALLPHLHTPILQHSGRQTYTVVWSWANLWSILLRFYKAALCQQFSRESLQSFQALISTDNLIEIPLLPQVTGQLSSQSYQPTLGGTFLSTQLSSSLVTMCHCRLTVSSFFIIGDCWDLRRERFGNLEISPPTPADDLLLDYCWDHANDDYRPKIILARKTV